MESPKDYRQRARRMAQGSEILGFRPMEAPSDAAPGQVLTFIYNSKTSGFKDKGLYDAAPMVISLGVRPVRTTISTWLDSTAITSTQS